MILGWERRDDYWTNITSSDFDRDLKYRGYLVTRRHELSNLIGVKKKLHAVVATLCIAVTTTRRYDKYEICPVGMPESIWRWRFGGSSAKGVGT